MWSVVTDGPAPAEGTVVSALPHGTGMRYRVVTPTRPTPDAQPLDPGLEDGYLALAGTQALRPATAPTAR